MKEDWGKKMTRYHNLARGVYGVSNWPVKCLNRLCGISYRLECIGRNYEQIKNFHKELNKRICELKEKELTKILGIMNLNLPRGWKYSFPVDPSRTIDLLLGVESEQKEIQKKKLKDGYHIPIHKFKSHHLDLKYGEMACDPSNE